MNCVRGVEKCARQFESNKTALGLVASSSKAMISKFLETAVSFKPLLVGGS